MSGRRHEGIAGATLAAIVVAILLLPTPFVRPPGGSVGRGPSSLAGLGATGAPYPPTGPTNVLAFGSATRSTAAASPTSSGGATGEPAQPTSREPNLRLPSSVGPPTALLFSPVDDDLYSASFSTGTVEVIGGLTDAPIGSVRVGLGPSALALDDATQVVAVANSNSSNLSLISTSTHRLLQGLALPGAPMTLTADTLHQELLVGALVPVGGLSYARLLVVGSGPWRVVASVNLSSTPSDRPVASAVDPVSGNLFEALWPSGTIVVVNLSARSVVSTLHDLPQLSSIVADGTGDLFLGESDGPSVLVLSGRTDEIVGSLDDSAGANGLAYAPALRLLAIADAGDANLTELNLSAGGSSPSTIPLGGGASAAVFSAPTGCLYLALPAEDELVVVPQSLQVELTAGRNATDVGHALTLAATISGGLPPVRAIVWQLGDGWEQDPAPLTLSHVYTSPGRFSVSLEAEDANSSTAVGSLLITVHALPTAALPITSSSEIDVGQSIVLREAVNGGTAPFQFDWEGPGPNCTAADTASPTCTLGSTGTVLIRVAVTDTLGESSGLSQGASVVVDPRPSGVSVSATPATVDVGQPMVFAASVAGGDGPYAFAWSGLPPGCRGTGASIACYPIVAGTFPVSVVASDPRGALSAPGTLALLVTTAPSVSVVTTRSHIDAFQTASLTASAVGGSGSYSISWSGLPSDCPTTGVAIACRFLSPGTYEVNATAVDSNGLAARSEGFAMTVAPALGIASAQIGGPSVPGSPISFAVDPTGGTPPFTLAWSFGDGGTASGSNVSHTFRTIGSYDVALWVNDSAGVARRWSVLLSVGDGLARSELSTSHGDGSLLAGVLVPAALAIAVAALLFVRRPHRRAARAHRRRPRWTAAVRRRSGRWLPGERRQL